MKFLELKKIVDGILIKRNSIIVKLRKTEHCIIMSVKTFEFPFNGDRPNHKNFYFTKNELRQILAGESIGESIKCKDIYSYCSVSNRLTISDNKILNFTFSWLDSNGNNLQGYIQNISLNFQQISDYVNRENEDEEIRIIEYKEKNKCKMVFLPEYRSVSNVKNISTKKEIKNKFVKIVSTEYLNNENYTMVKLSNDSMNKYSFYFMRYKKNKFCSNGGLIYHANSEERKTVYKNGKPYMDITIKGYYGIHT